MRNHFDIQLPAIKAILNPTNNPNGVLGSNSSIRGDDVMDVTLQYTSIVCDRLPDRPKKLLTTVDGEILCGRGRTNGGAVGGETTFFTSLKRISNLQLYKNYSGNWQRRSPDDRLPDSAFSYVSETGEITLKEPLKRRDTLIAHYDHDGMRDCLTLKLIVTNLVVGHLARISQMNEVKLESIIGLEQQAYIDLSRLRDKNPDGAIKLKLLDDIDLVVETDNGDFGNNGLISYSFGAGVSL